MAGRTGFLCSALFIAERPLTGLSFKRGALLKAPEPHLPRTRKSFRTPIDGQLMLTSTQVFSLSHLGIVILALKRPMKSVLTVTVPVRTTP